MKRARTDLPELHVDVVEAGQKARKNRRRCEIGTNLKFDETALATYCFANWDSRAHDALLVAAAVQFCDQTRARSSVKWARRFNLRIPVHHPETWASSRVSNPLHRALALLTGDEWHVTFVQRLRHAPEPLDPTLEFPASSQIILPYSGGLDSLSVSRLLEAECGHPPLLVHLGRGRAHTNGYSFARVPYSVPHLPGSRTESSARTRGFRFAVLAGVAAFFSRLQRIVVPESGQGALGPSLVAVGQSHPDCRAHPVFGRLMETFFRGLLDWEIRFSYPRLWFTKGETLRASLAEGTLATDLDQTNSCWQSRRHTSVLGKRRQCGTCAACMLRRMSLHAAGVPDSANSYVWENLKASRYVRGAASSFKNAKRTNALRRYAVAGVLHLEHLAQLAQLDIRAGHFDTAVFQLTRSIECGELELRANLNRMLKRHEEEWNAFLASLGARSFIAQWVAAIRQSRPGQLGVPASL